MTIVQPYARIIDFGKGCSGHAIGGNDPITPFGLGQGIALLRKIEWCARISHRSEDAQTATSYERFLRAVVVDHGDWSVTEHASVTTDWDVDRGVQQELTRHRQPSYTIESTRFVNYAKGQPARFVAPPEFKNERSRLFWGDAMRAAETSYLALLASGESPQIARDAFPLALAGRIICTANLRMWRHLFLMRTTRETHPKFRHVSLSLLAEFQATIPILFEDIEPMAKQSHNIKKVEELWSEPPQE